MRRWKTGDLELIKSGLYTTEELAEIFKVSTCSVWHIARKNGIKLRKDLHTKKEIEVCRNNYMKLTDLEIAKLLGVKEQRVKDIRTKYKLIKKSRSNWTDEQEKFIIDNRMTMNHSEIARVLGKSVHSIENRARKLMKEGKIQSTKGLFGGSKNFVDEMWKWRVDKNV